MSKISGLSGACECANSQGAERQVARPGRSSGRDVAKLRSRFAQARLLKGAVVVGSGSRSLVASRSGSSILFNRVRMSRAKAAERWLLARW